MFHVQAFNIPFSLAIEPTSSSMYPFFPKPMLQGFFAAFGRMFVEGAFDLKPERTLNEQFPEVKARKIKDLLFEAWGQ